VVEKTRAKETILNSTAEVGTCLLSPSTPVCPCTATYKENDNARPSDHKGGRCTCDHVQDTSKRQIILEWYSWQGGFSAGLSLEGESMVRYEWLSCALFNSKITPALPVR
jgi:hypothetical protein